MHRFRLLLDEMVSPSLKDRCFVEDVDALPIRDRGMLSATDPTVWRFAQREQRAVVTANGRDFIRLASETRHAGLVVIPNGGTRDEQFSYIKAAWTHVWGYSGFAASFENRITTVSENRSVSIESQRIQAEVVPIRRQIH